MSPLASGAPTEGRGRSPHGFFSELRFPPLYNLRRKYIQDIAFPPEDALGRGVKGTRGTNRLREIHAGVWRHCCPHGEASLRGGRRGLDGAGHRWMLCAALPLLWCGQCALLLYNGERRALQRHPILQNYAKQWMAIYGAPHSCAKSAWKMSHICMVIHYETPLLIFLASSKELSALPSPGGIRAAI